jgi:hypothetical protein
VQVLEDTIPTRRILNIISNIGNKNVEKQTMHGEIPEGAPARTTEGAEKHKKCIQQFSDWLGIRATS